MDTNTPTNFSDFVFSQPLLPRELHGELFANAPESTLVDLDGELYLLNSRRSWFALEELVTEGNFGSSYETWSATLPRR